LRCVLSLFVFGLYYGFNVLLSFTIVLYSGFLCFIVSFVRLFDLFNLCFFLHCLFKKGLIIIVIVYFRRFWIILLEFGLSLHFCYFKLLSYFNSVLLFISLFFYSFILDYFIVTFKNLSYIRILYCMNFYCLNVLLILY